MIGGCGRVGRSAMDEPSGFYRLSAFVVNAKFTEPWIFSMGGDLIRLMLRFFRLLLLPPCQFRPDPLQSDLPEESDLRGVNAIRCETSFGGKAIDNTGQND
jgi:hypothetical protein